MKKEEKQWGKYVQSLLMLWELAKMLVIKINKWDSVRASQIGSQLSVALSVIDQSITHSNAKAVNRQ